MIIHSAIIVGAGPAGVATATELINRGLAADSLLILEKSSQISNMVQSKYPDEKPVLANYKGQAAQCLGELCITDMTKQEFHAYLENVVAEKKITINFNQDVTKITKLRNGQWNVVSSSATYLTNSVFIAIGNMSAPRQLEAEIDISAYLLIHQDIQRIALDQKRILVVGGGDSASEYAQILSQRGHEVNLSYRKNEFSKMLSQNSDRLKELIKTGKVNFKPESIVAKVKKVEAGLMVEFNDSTQIEVQAIVTALGNEKPTSYLESLGIKLKIENEQGFIENEKGGLFYIGDLATGIKGGSINLAFDSANKAVNQACSLFLDCKS
jgi:thioredoxin reductase (NADPH)